MCAPASCSGASRRSPANLWHPELRHLFAGEHIMRLLQRRGGHMVWSDLLVSGRAQVKIKRLLATVAVICIGLSVYYADLLKAAFTLNPIPWSPESIARGKDIFLRNCVACHGPAGRGDGVAAASLPARPKDLSRLAPPTDISRRRDRLPDCQWCESHACMEGGAE